MDALTSAAILAALKRIGDEMEAHRREAARLASAAEAAVREMVIQGRSPRP